eukprot:TRINITY_DN166611_c0_g2_i1.p1 TRINITY_DN166611_c0_g2~~TRINITY_DN166611_c0_g2_i1.p1  ORF type:complete len:321 (+),score=69.26 TRINITY_DN166611_c0_g2_i1:953-1915(+)
MIDDLQGVIGGKMNVNLMMPIIEYMENGTVTIPIEWFTDMEFIFSLMRIANHLLLNELYDYLFHNCIEANKSNIEVCLKLLSQLVERDPHGLKFESISDWQRKCGNCVEVLKHDFLINGSEDLLRRVFELLNDDIKVSDESIECFKKWLEAHDGANPQIFQELVPMNLFSDDVITFKLIPNGYVDVTKALDWRIVQKSELIKELQKKVRESKSFKGCFGGIAVAAEKFCYTLEVGETVTVELHVVKSKKYKFLVGQYSRTLQFPHSGKIKIVVSHPSEKRWEVEKDGSDLRFFYENSGNKFTLIRENGKVEVYIDHRFCE